jgi:hypothetical protein
MKPLYAKNSGEDFEKCPEGTIQAVCIAVYDLGMQKTNFQDKKGKDIIQHKVIIRWEIDAEMQKGEYAGERFNISKRYTLSLNEKANLRKDLEGWRGKAFTDDEVKKGFDIYNLVGLNCNLSIVHEKGKDGSVYANVKAVSGLVKGQKKLSQETDTDKTPEWVTKLQEQAEIDIPGSETLNDTEEVPF